MAVEQRYIVWKEYFDPCMGRRQWEGGTCSAKKKEERGRKEQKERSAGVCVCVRWRKKAEKCRCGEVCCMAGGREE